LTAAHNQIRVDAGAKNFHFETFLENSRMATAMVFQLLAFNRSYVPWGETNSQA
jgi:hypothetical protein